MPKTRIQELSDLGQSIWLDYISRSLLESGKLQKMIEDGLRGMTSNPSIFHQAISSSSDYDTKIKELSTHRKSTLQIYDELTIADIRQAADIFLPLYQSTNRLDGYVSLEINPLLANNTEESIAEGKRLFQLVDRPNVMIKVPATEAGFPVIEELLAEGVNVNVTLIFSLQQYIDTADAYLKGLSRLAKRRADLSQIRSVASVFVSRIDTAIDKILEDRASRQDDEQLRAKLLSLRGKAAVANSKIIFAKFKEIFSEDQFHSLIVQGAEAQRVLWGSTGTKNPQYSDIKYVTELIGRPTVNTLPEKTIAAFLDHGVVHESLSVNLQEACQVIASLREFDIDIDAVCCQLLEEGLGAFDKAFTDLLSSIELKSQSLAKVSQSTK